MLVCVLRVIPPAYLFQLLDQLHYCMGVPAVGSAALPAWGVPAVGSAALLHGGVPAVGSAALLHGVFQLLDQLHYCMGCSSCWISCITAWGVPAVGSAALLHGVFQLLDQLHYCMGAPAVGSAALLHGVFQLLDQLHYCMGCSSCWISCITAWGVPAVGSAALLHGCSSCWISCITVWVLQLLDLLYGCSIMFYHVTKSIRSKSIQVSPPTPSSLPPLPTITSPPSPTFSSRRASLPGRLQHSLPVPHRNPHLPPGTNVPRPPVLPSSRRHSFLFPEQQHPGDPDPPSPISPESLPTLLDQCINTILQHSSDVLVTNASLRKRCVRCRGFPLF